MSDQLWESPTLAKSRIWEFVVHTWKISPQANTFIFSHNQPWPFVLETLLTSGTFRLLVKKNFRVPRAIIGTGHVSGLWESNKREQSRIFNWMRFSTDGIRVGATRNQKWERGWFTLRHQVWFPERKAAAKVFTLVSLSCLKCLTGRWWDRLKALILTVEQCQGFRVTQNSSDALHWGEPQETAISVSPERSNSSNFIRFNLTFIEINHRVCFSECRMHSVAEGSPEASGLRRLAQFWASSG